jgi:hypothetical protein
MGWLKNADDAGFDVTQKALNAVRGNQLVMKNQALVKYLKAQGHKTSTQTFNVRRLSDAKEDVIGFVTSFPNMEAIMATFDIAPDDHDTINNPDLVTNAWTGDNLVALFKAIEKALAEDVEETEA